MNMSTICQELAHKFDRMPEQDFINFVLRLSKIWLKRHKNVPDLDFSIHIDREKEDEDGV